MVRRFVFAIAILSLVAASDSSAAERLSAWGPIPEPADSTTAAFEDRGMPAWEAALVWPYRVVTFPVALAADGLGAGIVALDEGRVIYHIQELLKPPTVPFGFEAEASAGGTGGLGAGLTFYHDDFPGDGGKFRIGFESSLKGSHKAHSGFRVRSLEGGAGYRIRKSARFFGLGPDSDQEDESFFTQETSWAGAGIHRSFGGDRGLLLSAIYSTSGTRGPREDRDPPLLEVFPEAPLGYGDRSEGTSIGLELYSSPVRETGRPEIGTIARGLLVYFAAADDISPDFWTYRGELQQFLPLPLSKRALALRGVLSWIDPAGGGEVPFQRLLTNDEPDLFRGYSDFRFRDRGLLLLTAEYRWPVWATRDASGPGVDAYLLSDVGQVFEEFEEVSTENLTFSWGGGFRLIGGRGFTARIELAKADQDLQIRLAADQVFQYAGSALLDGRNPVPVR